MAEEPVTKWWAVGAKEESTARKYISFLHKHSMFGGHVGLPQDIRNEQPNRSLDSSRGMYDMVEVYSVSNTTCPTGTVVNFYIGNDINNPLGTTYVKPCYDTTKPMGYMVTKAAPDIYGICVVSGVLEVPLANVRGLSSDEFERKDYVEYDLEAAAFKFSDSGYPVFNVYQDVDGDWIAIILFGNTESDWKYDGQFAVSVAGVTGSTTFVDVLGGDVFFNDVRGFCEDFDTSFAISTGESLWLSTTIVGNTHSYSLVSQSNAPVDGSTVFYTKLAENNGGDIRQIHYGDIRYSRTKIIAGSNKITVSPSNGLGDVTIDVNESVIGGGTFYTPNYTQLAISGNTVPEGYLGQTFVFPVRAGTVGFFDDGGDARAVWTDKDGSTSVQLTSGNLYPATKDGWLRVSVIDGGTSSGACLSIQDSTGNLPIYKYGVFGSTVSPSINSIYEGPFSVRRIDGEVTGSTIANSFYVQIVDGCSRDTYHNYAGYMVDGIEKVPINSGTATCYPGSYLYLVGNTSSSYYTYSYEVTNGAVPTNYDFSTLLAYCPYIVNNNQVRIVQVQQGDIVAPPKKFTSSVNTTVGSGVATISVSGSKDVVKLIAGDNTTITGGINGEIIIGSTVSGGTGSSTGCFPDWENISGQTTYAPNAVHVAPSDGWLLVYSSIEAQRTTIGYASVVVNLGGGTNSSPSAHTAQYYVNYMGVSGDGLVSANMDSRHSALIPMKTGTSFNVEVLNETGVYTSFTMTTSINFYHN